MSPWAQATTYSAFFLSLVLSFFLFQSKLGYFFVKAQVACTIVIIVCVYLLSGKVGADDDRSIKELWIKTWGKTVTSAVLKLQQVQIQLRCNGKDWSSTKTNVKYSHTTPYNPFLLFLWHTPYIYPPTNPLLNYPFRPLSIHLFLRQCCDDFLVGWEASVSLISLGQYAFLHQLLSLLQRARDMC